MRRFAEKLPIECMLKLHSSSAHGDTIESNEISSCFFELIEDVGIVQGRVVRGLAKG